MLVDEGVELLEVDINNSIFSYFNELNRGGLTYKPFFNFFERLLICSCNF